MLYRHLWIVLPLIVGFHSASAWAQLTPDQQRIQDLEKKIEELDRRLTAAEAKTVGAPAPPAAVAPAPPQHCPRPNLRRRPRPGRSVPRTPESPPVRFRR